MHYRAATRTLADFVLRFVALAALTVAVLASVSVRASRDETPAAPNAAARYVPDTAEVVNDRRYPLVYADAAPRR